MIQGVGCMIGSVTSGFASDYFHVIDVIVWGLVGTCATFLANFANEFFQF
jgi:hypothetical protein